MRYFHRTNNVDNKAPSATDIGAGEIGINTSTSLGGRLYIKLADNSIVRFVGMPLGQGLKAAYGGTNNTFTGASAVVGDASANSLMVFKYNGGTPIIDNVKNSNLTWNETSSYLNINRSGQAASANLHVSGSVKFEGLSAFAGSAFGATNRIAMQLNTTNVLQYIDATGLFSYYGDNAIPTGIMSIVPVAKGGTNASTASGARSNLGLVIGTDVQPFSSVLSTVTSGTYVGGTGIGIVGTIQSGIWNGTGIAVNKGGTGSDLTVNSGTTSGSLIYYDYNSNGTHFLNKSSLLKWDAARTGLGIGLAVGTPPSGALHVSGSFYYGGRPAGGAGTTLVVNTTGDQVRELTSSMRFKDNISPYLKSIEDISKLNPVYFSYKSDPSVITAGLLAEDVSSAGMSEFVNYDGDNLPYSLSYGNMVVLLINAVKDLKKEIDELKTRIN